VIRKYLPLVFGTMVLFGVSVLAKGDDNIATSSPENIVVLDRNITMQRVTDCPKRAATPKKLAKYLAQYDVKLEKEFAYTQIFFFGLDEDGGIGSGALPRNWEKDLLEVITSQGFDTPVSLGEIGNPFEWMRFSGSGTCDFSGYQSWVSGTVAIQQISRHFLFNEERSGKYKLVLSYAQDQATADSPKMVTVLDVSGESYPLVIAADAVGRYLQWNPSIKGFNSCQRIKPKGIMDEDDGSAIKVYVNTAIAPKDSFLGKLCASPEARAKLDQFLDGEH